MMRTLIIMLVCSALLLSAIFVNQRISKLNLDLQEARVLSTRLNSQLRQTQQDKALFQQRLSKKAAPARAYLKQPEPEGQSSRAPSDVKALTEALMKARDSMQQMNGKLEQIKNEKAVLQEANLNMSNRLQNTTRELIRVIEESKSVKKELNKIAQKKIIPLKEEIKKRELIEALERSGGNQSEAARILGVTRVTVWNRMKRFGIYANRKTMYAG